MLFFFRSSAPLDNPTQKTLTLCRPPPRPRKKNPTTKKQLQKQRLQAEVNDRKTEREKAMAELRSLRDASTRGSLSAEQVEQRIADAEFKLTHESLSVQEEKRLREAKERLERVDRPAAVKAAALSTKLDEIKAATNASRDKITALDKQLTEIKAKQDACGQELDALRKKGDEAFSDVPALLEEKKEAYKIMTSLRQKAGELRDSYNAQWDVYKRAERAWRSVADAQRAEQRAAQKKEWEERQAARKAAAKAARPARFTEEIYLCDTTLTWLKRQQPKVAVVAAASAASASAAADADSATTANAPGKKLVSKKGAGEEDDWFGAFGTGANRRGKGAKREAAAAAAAQQRASQPARLMMTPDLITAFSKLGVALPVTQEDVPKALEGVEARRADYARQKAEWDAKKAAGEAASESEEEEDEAKEEAAAEGEADAKEAEAAEDKEEKKQEKKQEKKDKDEDGKAAKAEAKEEKKAEKKVEEEAEAKEDEKKAATASATVTAAAKEESSSGADKVKVKVSGGDAEGVKVVLEH